MIELPYSLIIEATDEPDYFGFHSPELEGFTGIGHSVENCLCQSGQVGDEGARRDPDRTTAAGSAEK